MVWSTRRQDSKLIDVCTANSIGFTETKKCINTYKKHPAVRALPSCCCERVQLGAAAALAMFCVTACLQLRTTHTAGMCRAMAFKYVEDCVRCVFIAVAERNSWVSIQAAAGCRRASTARACPSHRNLLNNFVSDLAYYVHAGSVGIS
eukprot:2897399-Rhodomonas_salina.7